ncbi:hypothetical protein KD913_09960 [Klebsiella pneumoniae]
MKANSHEQSRHADPQRAPADARRCAGAFNPFTAGAAPAFDYAQQQTQQSQAQEKNDAASAKQTQESRQSADNKKTGTSTSQLQKESPASRRRLHKKISLYSN